MSTDDFLKSYKKSKKKVKKEEAKEPCGDRTAINALPPLNKAEKFVKTYKKSCKSCGSMPCGSGLSGKICRRNKKKLNKSGAYDFKTTTVQVDAKLEHDAEKAAPELIEYLSSSINADLEKIRLAKGEVTVFKKDAGIYSGFFSDTDGQVVYEFENCTVPMIAKNLELREYYSAPPAPPVEGPAADEAIREMAREESEAQMDYHNATMHGPSAMKIKFGDFEVEIKKSMHKFINDFKRSEKSNSELESFVKAWRRNSKVGKLHKSNIEAAKELIKNWQDHGEEFSQIVDAIRKIRNEK